MSFWLDLWRSYRLWDGLFSGQSGSTGCIPGTLAIHPSLNRPGTLAIHPSLNRLLVFTRQGQNYHDCCLSMDCSISCNAFESLSNALQWLILHTFPVPYNVIYPWLHIFLAKLAHINADNHSIIFWHWQTFLPVTCSSRRPRQSFHPSNFYSRTR